VAKEAKYLYFFTKNMGICFSSEKNFEEVVEGLERWYVNMTLLMLLFKNMKQRIAIIFRLIIFNFYVRPCY